MAFKLDGNRIRRRRESEGKSRAEVADENGISESYVGLIELGYREPPMHTLAGVCRSVGMTVDDAFIEVDDPIEAFVRRTTEESGVPRRVEDPAVAEQVADLLRPALNEVGE